MNYTVLYYSEHKKNKKVIWLLTHISIKVEEWFEAKYFVPWPHSNLSSQLAKWWRQNLFVRLSRTFSHKSSEMCCIRERVLKAFKAVQNRLPMTRCIRTVKFSSQYKPVFVGKKSNRHPSPTQNPSTRYQLCICCWIGTYKLLSVLLKQLVACLQNK